MHTFLYIERKRRSHKDRGKETGFESITTPATREIEGNVFEMLLKSMKGYKDYIKKYGPHFTDALAEYVSQKFINADGTDHWWTASQAKKMFMSLGYDIPDDVSIGDITYLANMAYSDFYPTVLKDEAACLRYAYRVAIDPDGYEGLPFCRWTADVIGKGLDIDWELFI